MRIGRRGRTSFSEVITWGGFITEKWEKLFWGLHDWWQARLVLILTRLAAQAILGSLSDTLNTEKKGFNIFDENYAIFYRTFKSIVLTGFLTV